MYDAMFSACSALGSLWFAGLWQGAAVLFAAALLLRLQPSLAPRLQYRVWCAGYCIAALLPVLEWSRAAGSLHLPIAAPAAAAPWLLLDRRWALLCGGLWLLASLAAFVRLMAGLWSVRQLLQSATPVKPRNADAFGSLLKDAGRGPIALYGSDDVAAPAALGYWRPAIVLPQVLLASLDQEQMEQVMRHEVEHLRRRDDWAALCMSCVRCLFPLQLALLGFERQLRATREMACDDAVLRSAAPRAYASNLAQIAQSSARRRHLRMVLNLLGPHAELRSRVEHILAVRQQSEGMARRWLLTAAAGLLAVPSLLMQSPAMVGFYTQAAPLPLASTRLATQAAPTTTMPAQAAMRLAGAKEAWPAFSPAKLVQVSAPLHREAVRRAHAVQRAPRLLAVSRPTRPGSAVQAELAALTAAPSRVLVLWRPAHDEHGTFILAFTSAGGKAEFSQSFVLLAI